MNEWRWQVSSAVPLLRRFVWEHIYSVVLSCDTYLFEGMSSAVLWYAKYKNPYCHGTCTVYIYRSVVLCCGRISTKIHIVMEQNLSRYTECSAVLWCIKYKNPYCHGNKLVYRYTSVVLCCGRIKY